jgi:multidrug efflux pump subunit AcrA (membrane-fusion protein)
MTTTLEQITKAEAAAQDAAEKAMAAAEAARQRAEEARQRAEAERARAYRAFLDKITAEWPKARAAALTAVSESRAALEQAVRSGDDIFGAYLRWVEASVRAWEVDSELAQIRDYHGVPVRSTEPPVFRFDITISEIVDQIARELQGDAERRITDRRIGFVNGSTS